MYYRNYPLSLHNKIPFGKFRGTPVRMMFSKRYWYLVWLHEVTNCKLEQWIYELALKIRSNSKRYKKRYTIS